MTGFGVNYNWLFNPSATAQPRNRATAQPRNRATAQPRNRATAQPRNRATAQPRNRATAQPRNSAAILLPPPGFRCGGRPREPRCPGFANDCPDRGWGERPREPHCPESKTVRPDFVNSRPGFDNHCPVSQAPARIGEPLRRFFPVLPRISGPCPVFESCCPDSWDAAPFSQSSAAKPFARNCRKRTQRTQEKPAFCVLCVPSRPVSNSQPSTFKLTL